MSKITIDQAVVEQALDLIEENFLQLPKSSAWQSIQALRAALDQPQSNPTAQDIADSALLGNIESPFNACMHQEHCKRWKEWSGSAVEQKIRPGMVYALPTGDYVGVILRGRYYQLTTPQPPVAEQPQGERKPLTDEQIWELYCDWHKKPGKCYGFARAIETHHGIK